MDLKNWKTTYAGIIGALLGFGAIAGTVANYLPPKYAAIAAGVGVVATSIGNMAAKDYDVHSTQNEVRTATTEEKVDQREER